MARARSTPAYARLRSLLKKARKSAGLKQEEVAKRLGRPQSYVAKVEQGERRLDVVEYLELTDAIGADPLAILRGLIKGSDG